MANDLSEVIPQLLAQGLLALRENAIMPRLVNSDYDTMAVQKGATIDVPIPSAIAAQAVTPANVPPSTGDIQPTSVGINLDQWYEAPFYLTDKDLMEAMSGTIPMQASEAIKALGNNVDSFILANYLGLYGQAGTAGTTPFASSPVDATNVRKVLNKQLAPLQDRRCVLDPDAEGNALNLRAFQDVSWAGDPSVIAEGKINRKLGFSWHMDQNIPTHTAGTLSNGTTHTALVNVALAAGATGMNVDETTLTGTIVPGDIFTFDGHTTQHVITNTSTLTASGNAVTGITFLPATSAIVADDTEVTFADDHVVNLAFHRDCFAFATRPLADSTQGLGNIIQSAVDPVSGIALRLEVSREHKRTRFSYDILYGSDMVRADLGARLLG